MWDESRECLFLVCRQPPHCIPETYTNATSWYKLFTTVRDSDTKYSQDYNPFWCYKGAIGKVYHALNPKLTVIVPDVSLDLCLEATSASISVVLSCTVKGPECLCVTFYSLGQRSDVWAPTFSKCHFWPESAVFTHAGRPLPHQPAPDAHQLLPVRHGHHYVLLCSH